MMRPIAKAPQLKPILLYSEATPFGGSGMLARKCAGGVVFEGSAWGIGQALDFTPVEWDKLPPDRLRITRGEVML